MVGNPRKMRNGPAVPYSLNDGNLVAARRIAALRPPAEIDVDEALVRSLLADQHPDLAGLPLAEVGAGWDNLLWRLGDELLVRLPRRAAAAALAANEQRWLPALAPALPLTVPVPVRTGRPGDGYPWPWAVVRWLDGTSADRTEVTAAADAARRLGRFLRTLHTPAPGDAPYNPFRSVPLADRADTFEHRLELAAPEVDARAVRRVWDDACAAPPAPGPPVWVHGDLHPGNVLVAGGTLAGVLDWGDLCAGDAATDLAAAWLLLPSWARGTFVAAYADDDPAAAARARGWAVLFALMQLADTGPPTARDGALAALDRVTAKGD
jgi:aminoglycoside phosphotransferase (APT) family kinase protein